MSSGNIKLTIAFIDPDLDLDEREEQTQRFIAELKELDEINTVDRVPDPNPPEGNKAIASFLMGILTTEVNPANAAKLLGFLGDRLGNKPIELSVEGNGKKLSVKASSREELTAAIQADKEFIDG
ncbi:hypothetical protein H6G89_03630 [Oscillatoria sp. FACHB-1407]|uniref:hypothetical protein n=1 Tax=Oscillatoria sp. FACHB-1407 TaxID=2692847 RepID=UPI0016863206|nr:hypothetical protein [Oscillatoria sp. FACHB-1407]MBD2460129.1 hypothetical protein [Oscillatoria sp. FACHB-1407]